MFLNICFSSFEFTVLLPMLYFCPFSLLIIFCSIFISIIYSCFLSSTLSPFCLFSFLNNPCAILQSQLLSVFDFILIFLPFPSFRFFFLCAYTGKKNRNCVLGNHICDSVYHGDGQVSSISGNLEKFVYLKEDKNKF